VNSFTFRKFKRCSLLLPNASSLLHLSDEHPSFKRLLAYRLPGCKLNHLLASFDPQDPHLRHLLRHIEGPLSHPSPHLSLGLPGNHMPHDSHPMLALNSLHDLCTFQSLRLSVPLLEVYLLALDDSLVDQTKEDRGLMRLQKGQLLHQGEGVVQRLSQVVVKTLHQVRQLQLEVEVSTAHHRLPLVSLLKHCES